MLQSKLFTKTQREAPKDEVSQNAKLLIRGGFIDKLMAGVYTYLPLGLRVFRKIENIVREEMDMVGGQEILMPALHPKSIWDITGRWEGLKETMYQFEDRDKRWYALGLTHEEVVTLIAKKFIKSYSDLPVFIYQIQDKFRNEPRAKSGLLRCREFFMKDFYSFHRTESELNEFYEKMKKVYLRVFSRCGLRAFEVEASGGAFSKEFSHEFMVKTPAGEDETILCEFCGFAQNKEIARVKAGESCPRCNSGKLQLEKTVEVGNIFKLKTKYSKDFALNFLDRSGQSRQVVMGCYGIGLGRLMGTVVEIFYDQQGIIWPESVAPFSVHLLSLKSSDSKTYQKIKQESQKIYQSLQKKKIEVLYDDRDDVSAGEKFADADLIGIPIRLVISEKTLAKDSVEIKKRNEKKSSLLKLRETVNFFEK